MVAPNRSRSQSIHSSTTCSGAGAGGNEYNFCIIEPSRLEIGGAIDQVGWYAAFAGQLGQTLAVGAVLAAKHDGQIGLSRQDRNGFLAILSGVADIVFGWRRDVRKSLP